MAKHEVFFNLASVELGKVDSTIQIKKDGKQFGVITISKGDFEWWPSYAKKPYKISWNVLDKIIREYHGE